ncbi:MAG: hypothetical protein K2J27_05665 [Duncaniella sp.]|nr:hypothetical protein [Duncaniella sp.]
MTTNFFIPPYAENLYGKPEGFFKGIKVMAIGNSHYCTDGYDKDNRCGKRCRNYMVPGKCGNVNPMLNPPREFSFTQDVMDEYISYKCGKCKHVSWYNTFTKFARIFSNNVNWSDDKFIWESLCFYNFLDVAVENDKAPATPEEIDDAKTKILPAIAMCSPDVIVIWGGVNGLFNHLRDVFSHLPEDMKWIPQPENSRCGVLTIDDKDIKVACIDHPSNRKSDYYDNARTIIKSIAPELI